MENPFKFGTIVENEYFTDRTEEVRYIVQFLDGANHLVLISPRRFGKSSVVLKAVKQTGKPYLIINMQQVTSVSDFAAKLMRQVYKIHPFEKIKQFVKQFRIVPTLATNPMTGGIEVSFQPVQNPTVLLEDVMSLLDSISTDGNRLIIVLDEFQEALQLAPKFDKQLRSLMQLQQHLNYILLGSQESMMTEIFERKNSPFYHFGELMRLKKIPRQDFEDFLNARLQLCIQEDYDTISQKILDYTSCHPYYTQQLAAQIWQTRMLQPEVDDVFQTSIQRIVEMHSLDYERLWVQFNKTDKWVMQRVADSLPLQDGTHRTSTVYSSLKRLQKMGYVVYSSRFEIEDPFFRKWISDSN